MILLTYEEIKQVCHDEFYGSVLRTSTGEEIYRAIAKAQLKKVVEYLKENNESRTDGLKLYHWVWQSLLEEVKEG